ncbi:hypothetical protein [Alistipes ihumii]|uniref:hypothetical protein n=1 Tax=Alistipes ihumii TaxID=1470347 RepID=UPI003AB57AB0
MKNEKNNITVEQVYGMFEELKETIEKRPNAQTNAGATGSNDAIVRKLEENTVATNRHAGQVAALVNRLGQIDFQPNISVQPPDMEDINDAFEQIKVNYSAMAGDLKQIRTEIKTALSGEKIERAAQKIVSEDVDRYKAMLDGHWHNIYRLLEHLEKRIPWNYDIDKRLVKGCV